MPITRCVDRHATRDGFLNVPVERVDDAIAARNRQCTASTEVILDVEDQERGVIGP
jgi:hypothetical protein